jgi:hypothetical protein
VACKVYRWGIRGLFGEGRAQGERDRAYSFNDSGISVSEGWRNPMTNPTGAFFHEKLGKSVGTVGTDSDIRLIFQ